MVGEAGGLIVKDGKPRNEQRYCVMNGGFASLATIKERLVVPWVRLREVATECRVLRIHHEEERTWD